MMGTASEWHDAYAALLEGEIEALAWLPIPADTPDVVANLGSPSFVFSGAVLLAPACGTELYLTWKQQDHQYRLMANNRLDWLPNSLDRIRCTFDGPWKAIQGGRLAEVRLFQAPGLDDILQIVGVRHTIVHEHGEAWFWVGCGDADDLGDRDDLWVGVNVEPGNLADLVEIPI
ncbi:hypothetical protein [Asticcacaulis sp. AC402]|uniref:hypothetical protein n=1 Tax=Asticcacaulis sp. AC402 TaxID=1282361 RepID=UPI0003C3CF95|nr:hypothetical protein [Asticcacaulis sp. AC402]ESQ75639.1 hypothetical protein ABAC402_08930 [Asticcacaulis sp. AC402]